MVKLCVAPPHAIVAQLRTTAARGAWMPAFVVRTIHDDGDAETQIAHADARAERAASPSADLEGRTVNQLVVYKTYH